MYMFIPNRKGGREDSQSSRSSLVADIDDLTSLTRLFKSWDVWIIENCITLAENVAKNKTAKHKSSIWETQNLLTSADNSTNT